LFVHPPPPPPPVARLWFFLAGKSLATRDKSKSNELLFPTWARNWLQSIFLMTFSSSFYFFLPFVVIVIVVVVQQRNSTGSPEAGDTVCEAEGLWLCIGADIIKP